MSQIQITHPDGTKGTYTITNPQTWAAIQAVKPAKPPKIKAAKRSYPRWAGDMTTRTYIEQYGRLNPGLNVNGTSHTCANMDRIPAWAPDTVEIEVEV